MHKTDIKGQGADGLSLKTTSSTQQWDRIPDASVAREIVPGSVLDRPSHKVCLCATLKVLLNGAQDLY